MIKERPNINYSAGQGAPFPDPRSGRRTACKLVDSQSADLGYRPAGRTALLIFTGLYGMRMHATPNQN